MSEMQPMTESGAIRVKSLRAWPGIARPIQIVATPGSGNGQALDAARGLREMLRVRGHDTRLEVFGHLAELRRWATTGRSAFSTLIAVGGDGTQSTAAAAAVRQSAAFLIP